MKESKVHYCTILYNNYIQLQWAENLAHTMEITPLQEQKYNIREQKPLNHSKRVITPRPFRSRL